MKLFLDRDTLQRESDGSRTWTADIRMDSGDLSHVLVVVPEVLFAPLSQREVPDVLSRIVLQDSVEQAARRALLRPHSGGELVLDAADFA